MRKRKGRSILLAAAAAVASILGVAATPTRATPVGDVLANGNTSVTVNPTSSSGVSNWTVDGTNQLNQEWFWYSANGSSLAALNTVPLTSQVGPVDTIGAGDPPNYLSTTYTSGGTSPFQVVVTYNVTGGQAGSHASDLAEAVEITNTSSTATLNYQFIEYTNFNMGGATSPQDVSITGNDTATQENPNDFMVSQTVISPRANYSQVAAYSTILTELNSGTIAGGHLDDADGPLNGVDGEWAFEWDVTLAPEQSFTIGIDKDIRQVPEPATTVALWGLGGLFLTRPRRRDEDPDPRVAQVAEA
jgi:hypothetical protein